MSDDKILRFPGPGRSVPGNARADAPSPPAAGGDPLAALSEDQQKAIGLILGGATFVLVAIRPTDRGADFFTALHGDAADLRNAQPHLGGVIDRLFDRRGI